MGLEVLSNFAFLTSCGSSSESAMVGTSDKHVVFGGIRRVVSSILAVGRKIFVVLGEHDFSSFQVENVHW